MSENVLTLGNRLDVLASTNSERRKSSRFPIEREVRYKTLNQRAEILAGNGRTLNISSSGVLFTSDHDLPVGTRLEVSISWPAQLNEKCLLNLVARGRVTRHNKGHLALQIQQYEFRTQSRPGTIAG
ncbi:MAG: PilZ domain-containing protein [Acidobacteriaceae bacterium]|nr:PilZ domain-containing protein [Acidobacteriaceae bacterium]MBV9223668.1 PilZ domain-containing protein [Acidobacteriaceae bacterium]MBV9308396.1 PilZ domain-containing protein [Acidobacteriaceae bacterium]MBV9679547.1 PilZ domain-containing protein [Acidobacteriaceae bacterium]